MKNHSLSDADILLRLEEISHEKNVKLNFAHKSFYISLKKLCDGQGVYDPENNLHYVQLSINDFVETFGVSLTTVVQSLKLLAKCGLITRETNKRTFRKLTGGDYEKNGAYRTYLTKEID